MLAQNVTVDASHTVDNLGVRERDLHKSFHETVAWLAAAGHVSSKQAGAAVP